MWLYSFLNLGAKRGCLVNATSQQLIPHKVSLYPLYRRVDWPQRRSGRVRRISPPPGFDRWAVQRVALSTRLSRPTLLISLLLEVVLLKYVKWRLTCWYTGFYLIPDNIKLYNYIKSNTIKINLIKTNTKWRIFTINSLLTWNSLSYLLETSWLCSRCRQWQPETECLSG